MARKGHEDGQFSFHMETKSPEQPEPELSAARINPKCKAMATLGATQGQIDGFLSQLPYKYHLEEVASVED